MKSESSAVTAYYDAATRWFLRFGQTRRAGAIHRAVVLPDYAQLAPDDTVHALIVREIGLLGGDVSKFVFPSVERWLQKKIAGGQ